MTSLDSNLTCLSFMAAQIYQLDQPHCTRCLPCQQDCVPQVSHSRSPLRTAITSVGLLVLGSVLLVLCALHAQGSLGYHTSDGAVRLDYVVMLLLLLFRHICSALAPRC